MKLLSPYGIEEVRTKLRRGVKIEGSPVWFLSIDMLLPKGLRGNIKGNTFWLQYMRPRMFSLAPQRCFYGTLTEEENGTVIEGKFKMTPSVKGVFLAEFCILLLVCLCMQLPPVFLVLFAAVLSLAPFLSCICYEKEEKEVIDHLNKLA